MVKTFEDIARGAALQTGTEVTIADEMRLYAPTKPHPRLGELLREELRKQGVDAVPDVLVLASTDFGNVSQAVPADYIGFPVATKRIGGHNIEMREASITDLAHRNAFIVVEALAAAARRIATDAAFRAALKG
jgi:metal-dependent amidase/aminoacylase/carboxypeptidase family protein